MRLPTSTHPATSRAPRPALAIVLCMLVVASSAAIEAQDARVLEAVAVHIAVTVPADTPADSAVYLAGSLPAVGNWKADGLKLARQDDGVYAADVKLDVGSTLEFKFNRGSWDTVEKSADGGERANRSVTIDAGTNRVEATVERWASGPATRPASTVVGTLRQHEFFCMAMSAKRVIRVWLPPGYNASGNTTYDVLYLHDGQNCFDRATAAFGNEWEVDETLTKLILAKEIRPIIVVGIDNGGANRINELTYDSDVGHGGGQAAGYARFLLVDIRPLVEKTYRVATGREHTFLGGSSLGGLASLEIARRNPDTFAGVIAMSPSLWWNDQSVIRSIEKSAAGLKGTRVWLDMGTRENADAAPKNANALLAARRLDTVLQAAGIGHRLLVAEDAEHNEQAWAKRFPEAIRYVLNP